MCSAARLIRRSGVPQTLSPLGVECRENCAYPTGVETVRFRLVGRLQIYLVSLPLFEVIAFDSPSHHPVGSRIQSYGKDSVFEN